MGNPLRLRILTFNTHLMANSNVVIGAWYSNKLPVTFLDEHRHAHIVKYILNSGADIVALQEVWAADRMDQIRRELKDNYGFSAAGSGGAPLIDITAAVLDHKFPDHAAGSGLVLLSKYPLVDVEFGRYAGAKDDEERAASKGVLTATVLINNKPLRLGMTHAFTDAGGPDCANITALRQQTFMSSHSSYYPKNTIVLMGDFNIHRQGEKEKYVRMNAQLEVFGLKDTWTLAHGTNIDGSETDDQAHNNLAQFFSPMRNTEPADCIDYMYLRSTPDLPVKVVSAQVLTDWKTGRSPNWYWVHEGTVHGMPSATPFGPNGDKLCVATRESDNRVRVAVCDRKTNLWKSKLLDGVSAIGPPGLAWWQGALHLFYQGASSLEVLKVESQDGETWTQPNRQGFGTSGGCCAVVFQQLLHVFVKHDRGDQIFYYYWTGSAWSGPQKIALETDHNISAAATDNEMCVVVRDRGNLPGGVMNVRINREGKVSPVHQIAQGASTTGSPGITAFNGNFLVFYRSDSGDGEIFTRISGDNWQKWQGTGYETTDEVCPVGWGNKIVLFFAKPVWNTRKVVPGKVTYPYDAVLYPERPLTHAYWPSDVRLDLSDHYPYLVDLDVTV